MSSSIETQQALLDKLTLAVDTTQRCIGHIEKANYNHRDKVAQLWNLSDLQEGCFNRHPLPNSREVALFRARNIDSEEAEKIVEGFEMVATKYEINREIIEKMIKHEEIQQALEQYSGTDASLGNSGYFGNCRMIKEDSP